MGFQVFNLENDATCVHSKTRDWGTLRKKFVKIINSEENVQILYDNSPYACCHQTTTTPNSENANCKFHQKLISKQQRRKEKPLWKNESVRVCRKLHVTWSCIRYISVTAKPLRVLMVGSYMLFRIDHITLWSFPFRSGIIHVQVVIDLFDRHLDQHSFDILINTLLTLDWHLTDILLTTRSTTQFTVGCESTKFCRHTMVC